VVVARFEVARTFEHEIEARMEAELFEEVVVDPGAGRDADAPLTIERKAGRKARLRGRADRAYAAPARDGGAAERFEQAIVVLAVEHRHAKRAGERAHDDPLREQVGRDLVGVVGRDVEEVGV